MHETQSDHFLSTVVLLERSGRYFVYEPGLALIVSDGNIKVAHDKFVDARRTYFEEVDRAGLTFNARPLAAGSAGRAQRLVGRSFGGELKLFVAKTCIVLVVIAGIGAGAGLVIQQLIAGNSSQGGISMVDIANKAEVIVKDVQAMPRERKDSLRRSIGILSREVDPIVEAWRNPPPVPENGSSPSSSVPSK